jgi:hypothetical protein
VTDVDINGVMMPKEEWDALLAEMAMRERLRGWADRIHAEKEGK